MVKSLPQKNVNLHPKERHGKGSHMSIMDHWNNLKSTTTKLLRMASKISVISNILFSFNT
jgi:hypothetical protein